MSDQKNWLITHQQQPCPTSCVSTCIAMILGEPVAAVRDRIHAVYHEAQLSLAELLTREGIEYIDFRTADRINIDRPGVYICAVPSLNMKNTFHQVLIERLACGTWAVFDPNKGKEGRYYYVAASAADEKYAVELDGAFIVEAYLPRIDLAACPIKETTP